MIRLSLCILAVFSLAGCAGSQWRTMSIDGSDEAAFGESLGLINQELSNARRNMLALALIDIAQTGVANAGQAEDGSPGYTEEEFRSQLNGLTYDEVIALADESGLPIYQLYYYTGRRAADSSQTFAPPRETGPVFWSDGRPIEDYRPGGARWPLGAGNDGRPVYPDD